MAKKIKKRKPAFVICRGNVKVPGYAREQIKNGKAYASYVVPDHSSGKRKLWTYGDLGEAKAKAEEIALAIHCGKPDVLRWEDGLRAEIRKSLEAVESTGMSLLPACQLFAQAVQILDGKSDELLAACQHYKTHRPEKPFTPKLTKEAVTEFSAKKRLKVGARRWRSLESYLNRFAGRFGKKHLHEVERTELQDFVDCHKWAPKTHNDFLGGLSLLYQEGQFRGWIPPACNPAKSIRRRKLVGATVHVFEPSEARQMFSRVDAGLVPFLALWCFAGIRKEEISRMTWQQVNRGLEAGWILLEASQTKTGVARSVPVMDNLRAWLRRYTRASGSILPARWQGISRIDGVAAYISQKTGVRWKANAPRHSFGTYYFKVCKDPGEVVKAMGNSLKEFEAHYWCKANSITDASATEWFSVLPDDAEKVVELPKESWTTPVPISHNAAVASTTIVVDAANAGAAYGVTTL